MAGQAVVETGVEALEPVEVPGTAVVREGDARLLPLVKRPARELRVVARARVDRQLTDSYTTTVSQTCTTVLQLHYVKTFIVTVMLERY